MGLRRSSDPTPAGDPDTPFPVRPVPRALPRKRRALTLHRSAGSAVLV